LFTSQADPTDPATGNICHAFTQATCHPSSTGQYHPIPKARPKIFVISFGSPVCLSLGIKL